MDTIVTWSIRALFSLLAFACVACTSPGEVEAKTYSPEDYTEMKQLDEPIQFAAATQAKEQQNTGESRREASGPETGIQLNRASAQKLQQIPGIGPALAERILQYRSERKFKETSDLKRIDGIGEVSFEKMKPYVSVN